MTELKSLLDPDLRGSRRLMKIVVDPVFFKFLIRGKVQFFETNAPEDLQVLGCFLDASEPNGFFVSNRMVLIVASGTFDEIIEGQTIPEFMLEIIDLTSELGLSGKDIRDKLKVNCGMKAIN